MSVIVTPTVQQITVSPTVQSQTVVDGVGPPTGPAGGDLTGTYPNPTIAAGAVTATTIAANAVGTSAIKNNEVTYAKLPDQVTSTLLGRYSVGTGDPEVVQLDATLALDSVGGTLGIPNAGVSLAKLQTVSTTTMLGRRTAGTGSVESLSATQAREVLGLATTDSPQFAGLTLANGEFLTNASNGRIELGPNGTHPSQPTQDYFSLTVDGASWGYGVSLGNRNTRTNVDNTQGSIRFLCTMLTADATPISFGSSQYYSMSQRAAGGNQCLTIGALVNNAASSGAVVITENNQAGAANRVPSTDHVDPTLYIYGRGSSNAADYVRISHNTTDGTLEAGRGVMIVTGASGVRINGNFGFATAPTAVQTGYTTFTNLTTDRTCDADATSVAELADILGTLIQDLKAKGIISA